MTYRLAQRPALSDGDLVTLLNTEGRGDMGREVLVSLLVTGVLGDEVEVFAADNDGPVHLGGHNSARQDTSTDRNETGEGALLVCASSYCQQMFEPPCAHDRSLRSPSSPPERQAAREPCLLAADLQRVRRP